MTQLNTLMAQSDKLQKEIQHLQQLIKSVPPYRLVSRQRNNSRFEYSIRDRDIFGDEHEKYLSAGDHKLAEQLALRDYAKARLKDAIREKNAIDIYISSLTAERKTDILLRNHPGLSALVLPQLRSKEDAVAKWRDAEYKRSTRHAENLKYPTVIPGLFVRSKSEADIISSLEFFGIPFRYEEEIIINGVAYHPDFSCLSPTTFEIKYWEHQGGWDKESYIEPLKNREATLASVGIIPWKNLIITTETLDQPLDITWVDMLIQYFLL